MIAGRMQKKNGRGSWMVYKDCDEEYAEQVTSEHKISVRNGQKIQQIWTPKKTHVDNHYLDAEVYAMAAADTRGVRNLHLESIQESVKKSESTQHTPEEEWINLNEDWISG